MLVLLFLVAAAVLSVGAAWLVAKITARTMQRLGLELWSVLCWFGLAEEQHDELAARRAAPRTSKVRPISAA